MNKPIVNHTRRSALRLTGATALGLGIAQLINPEEIFAADDEVEAFNRFPRMVHNYYLAEVIRAERRGLARKAALKTKADAEAHVVDIRKKIASCFAPFPKKKSPLNAKIVGVVDRETYTI
jgi:hypothetical protein